MPANGISVAEGFKARRKIAMPGSARGRMQVKILFWGFEEEFYSFEFDETGTGSIAQ
jgi:hypothetical protein